MDAAIPDLVDSGAFGDLVNLLHGFVAYYPNSLTYYYWLRIVPLGYCLFLGAVGSLVWVTDVQLCMLWGAILFLCLAVNQISTAAGLAALILLASSTHWSYQQASILSEGLFLPLLLVNVGAAIFAITSPGKRRWPIIAALSAAGLMFVRPAGYYALLGVFFLLIAMWSRFALKWLLAPFVIFLAATMAINFAVRGPGAQSSVGRVLFPLVVLLYEPQFSPDSDREFGMAAAAAVEAYRAKFKQAGSAIDRAQFLADNYNPISLVAERAIVTTIMASSGIGNDVNAFRTRMERLQLRLFLQTVSNNPLGYLNLVGDQLVWAWEESILAYYHPPHRSMAAETGLLAYRQKVLATHKVPQETSVLIPDLARYTGFSAALLDEFSNTYRNIQTERWLVYLLGLVTFAAPFAFFIRSRRILAVGYCGVMIHGSVLLTCTTTVFIGRYAMPVDPILLVAAAILIDGLISVGVSQLRRLRAPKARPTLQGSAA